MKKWLFIIIGTALAIWLLSCVGKKVNTEEFQPQVVIAEGCDMPPSKLVDKIINDTNRFCREESSPGVERVIICHRSAADMTAVSYLCRKVVQ